MDILQLKEDIKPKVMSYHNDISECMKAEFGAKMGNREITPKLKELFNTAVESVTLHYANHTVNEPQSKYKCAWFEPSRNHRNTELKRGDGLEGTDHYKANGCYTCDGYKPLCDNRIDKKE